MITRTILLMLLYILFAAVIIGLFYGLMRWSEIEASKADDKFYVKAGWVSEPVLSESEAR